MRLAETGKRKYGLEVLKRKNQLCHVHKLEFLLHCHAAVVRIATCFVMALACSAQTEDCCKFPEACLQVAAYNMILLYAATVTA